MNDAEIRVQLLTLIRSASKGRTKPTIAAEFSLGPTGVRADLALLGDEFIGIEIKSAADTLRRLPTQLLGYHRYFDKTIVAAAARHEPKLNAEVLSQTSLWLIDETGTLQPTRCAPSMDLQTKPWAELFTQTERTRYLRPLVEPDEAGPRNPDAADLRRAFRLMFEARYGETSRMFWAAVSGRKITCEDLPNLSRFHSIRARDKTFAADRANFWASWVEELNGTAVAA